MTNTAQSAEIATLADSADGMMIARRAKNWLFSLLLVMLLAQIGLFAAVRGSGQLAAAVHVHSATGVVAADAPTPSQRMLWLAELLAYLTAIIDFLGIALVLVLAMVLLLMANIMLTHRTIGMGRATSAFIWCLVLAALLFPWQAFLSPLELKIPGVLYTWHDLTDPVRGANFSGANWHANVLHWARFVVFPALALIILVVIQVKATRGARLALGESSAVPTSEPTA